MRAVLDTSVLVAAIRSSQGASNLLLQACLARRFTSLVSVPLVLEYEAVLTRNEHLREAGLTREEVHIVLDAIVKVSDPVRLSFSWRPATKDPEDDMVLETAVNGNAELLVTFNQRDFVPLATRFGIEVLLPKQVLERLAQR